MHAESEISVMVRYELMWLDHDMDFTHVLLELISGAQTSQYSTSLIIYTE